MRISEIMNIISWTVLFRDGKMTSTSEVEIQISHHPCKLKKCPRQKYQIEILPASLLAITLMLIKITVIIGCKGL